MDEEVKVEEVPAVPAEVKEPTGPVETSPGHWFYPMPG